MTFPWAQTIFLKELSLLAHKFYGGKMMTVPKAGLYGFNWFNVWYTPGVSRVSTSIRGSQEWFVPGVTNLDQFDPECEIRPLTRTVEKEVNVVVKTAAGFGGQNAVMILASGSRDA